MIGEAAVRFTATRTRRRLSSQGRRRRRWRRDGGRVPGRRRRRQRHQKRAGERRGICGLRVRRRRRQVRPHRATLWKMTVPDVISAVVLGAGRHEAEELLALAGAVGGSAEAAGEELDAERIAVRRRTAQRPGNCQC